VRELERRKSHAVLDTLAWYYYQLSRHASDVAARDQWSEKAERSIRSVYAAVDRSDAFAYRMVSRHYGVITGASANGA
jgi:hypothetical protein